jgi:hypothetical protein
MARRNAAGPQPSMADERIAALRSSLNRTTVTKKAPVETGALIREGNKELTSGRGF